MGLTFADLIVLGVITLSAVFGLMRGFTREVLSLGSWVGAGVAAWYGQPLLRPFALEQIGDPTAADIVSALVIFLGALIILIIIFRILPIPSWIMLGLWFTLQLVQAGLADPANGGVAYAAHAGGFIAGLLLTLPIWLRLGGPRFWSQTEGHPDHPEARYRIARTTIPRVDRRR